MIRTLITIILIYIGFCLLLYWRQEKLLFFPQPLDPHSKALWQGLEHELKVGDVRLRGWLVKGQVSPAEPMILYFGGNGEEVSYNLNANAHFSTDSFLYMNYRGFGESGGNLTLSTAIADGLAIFDHVVSDLQIDPAHIVIVGRSLGSGVATYVASQRKPRGLILVTPYDSIASVAKAAFPLFPAKLILKHNLDNIEFSKGVSCPSLLIAAEQDQIIPLKHSKALFDRWQGGSKQWQLIPQADHNDISGYPSYYSRINQFLQKLSEH